LKQIKELPIGAKVKEEKSGEVFLVADHHHTGYNGLLLVADNVVMYACMDAAEPDNPDKEIAEGGNNDYELSNIHQWLNSAEGQWYHPTHPYDAPPVDDNIDYGDQEAYEVPFFSDEAKFLGDYSLENKSGFLSWFSKEFVDALVVNDIPCYTPPLPGEIHYGPVPPKYIKAKVFLMSASELGYEDLRFGNEGSRIRLFNEPRMRVAVPTGRALGRGPEYVYNDIAFCYFLRTRLNGASKNQFMVFASEHKVGDVNNVVLKGGYARSVNGIRPALCIKSDTAVTDTADENGVYTFVFQGGE